MKALTYDDVIFKLQKFGGVSTYWRNLIVHMKASYGENFSVIESKKISRFTSPRVDSKVFHSSYFRVPRGGKSVNVVTVHDLIYEKGMMPKSMGTSYNCYERKKAVLACDAIVCISHNTYSDLLSHYGSVIERKKIKVIHHGVDLSKFTVQASARIADAKDVLSGVPFYLFVGGRRAYKNFSLLANSYPLTQACKAGVKVVFTGSSFDAEEKGLISGLGLSGIFVDHGIASESDLLSLYRRALGLIYPSSYEGFGLPIVEAMANGCPVIASNASCMPEIVGEAGLLFSEGSIEELAAQIDSLLDASHRSAYVEMGKVRSRKFDLKSSMDSHLEFYQELI